MYEIIAIRYGSVRSRKSELFHRFHAYGEDDAPQAMDFFFYVLRASEPPPDAVQVADGVYLGSNAKRLKALLERDKPLEGLRIYAGHAAWAPGQLETEVARGFWKSARPDARSIFATRPETLWPELIRRAAATPVRLEVD